MTVFVLKVIFFLMASLLAGLTGRLVIVTLNGYAIALIGYKLATILVIPWIETAWLLYLARITGNGEWFGLALFGGVIGFQFQERLLFWPHMPTVGMRYYIEFWTFAPSSVLVGAVLFLFCRSRAHPTVGFLLWGVGHSLWNFYWWMV